MSDNNFGAISTIDKNEENGYYIVKWKSDSYNVQSSHKIGINFIKAGELVFDVVYFNPFANSKQRYTPYGGEIKDFFKRLSTII